MRSFKIKNARLVYLTLLQMISATVKGNTNHCGLSYPSVPAPPTQPPPALSTSYNQPLASFNRKLGVPTRFYRTKGALCFSNHFLLCTFDTVFSL